jgi:hypothetical protein
MLPAAAVDVATACREMWWVNGGREREKRRRESGREKIFGEPVKEGRRFGEEEGRERKKSSVLCFSLRLCIFFLLLLMWQLLIGCCKCCVLRIIRTKVKFIYVSKYKNSTT